MALDFPPVGLGTSGMDDPAVCRQSVMQALEVGYRHVDTAQMYDNEGPVGEAIRDSPIDREEVIVATKIHPDNLAYEDTKQTARESLDRLGLDTVDLLYVHWPVGEYDPEESLQALQELKSEGLTRHVGVSNFTPDLLDDARQRLDAPITAHQVECHPLLQQSELRAYAREHGHALVAYCPLGQAKLSHPVLDDIADKHGISVPLVSLAWCLAQEAVVPIPKATGEHIRENWEAQEIHLDDDDFDRIAGIEETNRLVDPDAAAWHYTGRQNV